MQLMTHPNIFNIFTNDEVDHDNVDNKIIEDDEPQGSP